MTEIRGPTFTIPTRQPTGVEQPGSAGNIRPSGQTSGSDSVSTPFDRVLQSELRSEAPIQFSRHAQDRIRARGIQITPHEMDRLGQAVEMAAQRGAKDSLIVSGPLSFVVDVPGRTVVTALSADQSQGHVFTKIDSAVVL